MTTQEDILGIPPRMNHNRPAPEPENLLPAVRDVPLIPAKPVAQYSTSTSIMELRMLLEMAKRPKDAETVKFNHAPTPISGRRTLRESVMDMLDEESMTINALAEKLGKRRKPVSGAVSDLKRLGYIRPFEDDGETKYEVVDKGTFIMQKQDDDYYINRRKHILSVMTGEHSRDDICKLAGLTETICYNALSHMVTLGMLKVRLERAGGRNLYSKA